MSILKRLIGSAPSQVSRNKDLGNLAFQNKESIFIGTNAPLGGTTNPLISSAGSANNYIQGYIWNSTNGTNASADLIAYPNNGTDSSGWIDMGITSQTFSQSAYSVTGANEGYIFMSAPSGSSTTGNLVLATDSTGTANAIQFYTGGFNAAKSAAKMTLDSSGNLIQTVNSTAPTLSTNKTLAFELTSDTQLKIKVRGSDGVTRSTTLTLS